MQSSYRTRDKRDAPTEADPSPTLAPLRSPRHIANGWRSAALFVALVIVACGPAEVWALDSQKALGQFNVHTWTSQSGLPAREITALAQAQDGFIWLAANANLVRFDGQEFLPVAIGLVDPRQSLLAITPSAKGGLWIAAARNGVLHYPGGIALASATAMRWRNDSPNALLEARNGDVWTGSELGLGRYSAQSHTFAVIDQTLGTVLSICEDSTGRIWIGTADRGLFVWKYGHLIAAPDLELKHHRLNALATDAGGHIWVGAEDGVRCYDANGRPISTPPFSENVRALYADRSGDLWIGTNGSGLGRFHAGAFSTLRKADGLASDNVTAIAEDREGSLWIATSEGLSQISDVKFPIFSAKEGLAIGSVHCVAPSRRGGLWLSTNGGFTYLDQSGAKSYGEAFLRSNTYIKLVFEARNGDVYLVDGDKTISVVSGDRVVNRIPAPDWPEALAEDAVSVLINIGPELCRIQNGKLLPYQYATGQPPPRYDWITNLSVGVDGSILVGSANGFFRVKDGHYTQWTTANGLASDRVNFAVEDPDGTIWVGLPAGIARIRNGQVRNITERNGLPDSKVFAIVPDNQGSIWMLCFRGIVRVTRANLDACADGRSPLIYELFDSTEAVKTTERSDQGFFGCKTADGRIWLPSPQGVIMIDPTRYWRNSVPPEIHINRVQSGTVAASQSNAISGQAEFTFAALSYIAPRKLQVQYRLRELDPAWVDAGARRSVRFKSVPAGEYHFEVRATNADGARAASVNTFKILPPFYRTLWFYGACTVLGFMVLGGVYRWKVRRMALSQQRLARENELLEQKVADRTRELAREQALLRALLDNSPDRIYFKDAQSRYLSASRAQAADFGLGSADALLGKSDFDFLEPEHARRGFEQERQIISHGAPLIGQIEREVRKDGHEGWLLTSKMPLRNAAGEIVGTFGVSKDITAIKQAEARLEEAHRQLVETSRQAGMAEVATNVLHNVGNVLTSANVSTTLLVDGLQQMRVFAVPKLAQMLEAHASELAAFLAEDPKGRKFIPYLAALGNDLVGSRDRMVAELENLRKNIDHIKEVVAMQQNLATACALREQTPIVPLVEDAVRLQASEFERYHIQIQRDFAAQPVLNTERHKILQIVVNLLQNATHACRDAKSDQRQITVRLEQDGCVRLSVIDNGVGIPPENLTRIFGHGFTTKINGHGFGLHSSALAARDLGGEIRVHSDGPNCGARFTLELPLDPPAPRES